MEVTMESEKEFCFEFSGGIGKHIMFTSFIKWVNEKFPDRKITVISAYPEVFDYNPRIHRNLPMQQAYLFEDYIKGKDYRKADPYLRHEFFQDKDKMHFNEVCPVAFGFEDYNMMHHNEIFLTKGERIEFIELEKKKVITLQAYGGIPAGHPINIREKVDCSDRDIPLPMAMKIVGILASKGYEVIQIRGPTEPIIPGTTQIGVPNMGMPFRNAMSMGIHCKGHIGIDSSYMHAMAAFERPQMIFWAQTHVDNLGYKYPKVKNIWREGSMKCMPNLSMPDRKGFYPRTDPEIDTHWNYTDEELEKYIDEFISLIK